MEWSLPLHLAQSRKCWKRMPALVIPCFLLPSPSLPPNILSQRLGSFFTYVLEYLLLCWKEATLDCYEPFSKMVYVDFWSPRISLSQKVLTLASTGHLLSLHLTHPRGPAVTCSLAFKAIHDGLSSPISSMSPSIADVVHRVLFTGPCGSLGPEHLPPGQYMTLTLPSPAQCLPLPRPSPALSTLRNYSFL